MQRIDSRTTHFPTNHLSLVCFTSTFVGARAFWRTCQHTMHHQQCMVLHSCFICVFFGGFCHTLHGSALCMVWDELWRSRSFVVYAWRPGIVSFFVTQRLRRYHWVGVRVVADFIGWRFNTIFWRGNQPAVSSCRYGDRLRVEDTRPPFHFPGSTGTLHYIDRSNITVPSHPTQYMGNVIIKDPLDGEVDHLDVSLHSSQSNIKQKP
jgi:hypothetical protein